MKDEVDIDLECPIFWADLGGRVVLAVGSASPIGGLNGATLLKDAQSFFLYPWSVRDASNLSGPHVEEPLGMRVFATVQEKLGPQACLWDLVEAGMRQLSHQSNEGLAGWRTGQHAAAP